MNKKNELLNSLLTLNKIIKNLKDDDNSIHESTFHINRYKITLYFIYESVTINIRRGCTLHSYVLEFKDGKYGEEEIKKIKLISSLPDLPTDLIIRELNKIGVKELWLI